jgi:hypothetical protein
VPTLGKPVGVLDLVVPVREGEKIVRQIEHLFLNRLGGLKHSVCSARTKLNTFLLAAARSMR